MPATNVTAAAVTLSDVESAAARIADFIHRTPVMHSRLFNEAAGCECFFKCENLQRGGSFKMRGAANFLLSIPEEQRKRGVVAYSSGNHGQAVAIAAQRLNVPATIVMPQDAPAAKIESTRARGATIVLYDRLSGNREEIGGRIAAETNAFIVPPYDHPWTIAGQGTATLELLDQVPDLDAIAVPLGGGGLLSGTATAAKGLRSGIRVFGVEPEVANDWALSLKAGQPVAIPMPPTIADGLRTQQPGAVTFPIVNWLVDQVLLVSEEELRATVRFLLTRLKLVAEPSGVAASAAALHRKIPSGVKRLGIIITGGNIDLPALAEICTPVA